MRRSLILFLVLALFASFGVLLIFHRNPVVGKESSKSREVSPASGLVSQESQAQERQTQFPNTPSSSQLPSNVITATNTTAKPKDIEEWMQREYGHSLEFYGEVADENEIPIPDASISFGWVNWKGEGQHASASSDNAGLFSLHGATGKNLKLDVSKAGYYSKGSRFEYADPGRGLHVPNPAKPVIFHLRKMGIGADLIHGMKLFGSGIDGTVSYVDLATGNNALAPVGDLTVQFNRGERNSNKQFDWTFTLGVVDGGLVESTNEYMFLAPDNGYLPTFQVTHKIGDTDWIAQEKHRFYVKSQGGQHYARIEIKIIPYYQNNAAFDLTWDLNATGSQNLEPK